MNRRAFIKMGTALVAVSVGCSPRDGKQRKAGYGITIDSNRSIGHLARKAMLQGIHKELSTDVLVVGGGIAGLSAACALQGRETVVCELGPTFGGSASAVSIGNRHFAQGAHYDISYPNYFGKEGLQLLERLGVITHNNTLDRWDFADRQFIIDPKQEERCFKHGNHFSSVLPSSELKQNFLDLLQPYAGKMPLPTTNIAASERWLDEQNFATYLNKYLPVTNEFIEAIDYQMVDDFGGTSEQVSALAGVHYYRCRPYFESPEPEVFSPTEGNYYFIRKMMESLPSDSLKANHLVVGLRPAKQGWEVDVWDVQQEQKLRYQCRNVVYAGQKHLLKYLHQPAYEPFRDVVYTPWVSINLELENDSIPDNVWQNDYLSSNAQFMGFVNSGAQSGKGNRVLTAYYCYPDVYHNIVQEIEAGAEEIVTQTIEFIGRYYNLDLTPMVKQVYVKLIGHAMPLPLPGYLSKQRNLLQNGLTFAGSDTGRLPLMFDSLDSGIQAAQRIKL